MLRKNERNCVAGKGNVRTFTEICYGNYQNGAIRAVTYFMKTIRDRIEFIVYALAMVAVFLATMAAFEHRF